MSKLTWFAFFAIAACGIAEGRQDPGKTQTVIAEGVGLTAEEALKDAARSAVRQVVGVLIDSETLIKNDKVIEDKVLTLSNGFVKKYETLSEKKDGGLIRVRIKAEVERGQVAAKLKEFKVITTPVDGERLAIEKMTKDEVQKNTTELLKKVLSGMPKTLKAELIGQPKEAKMGGYSFKIRVEPDLDALTTVGKDLVAVLTKASSRKEELFYGSGNKMRPITNGTASFIEDLGRPFRKPASESSDKDVAVWVMSWVGEKRNSARLNGYLVQANAKELAEVLDGVFTVHVDFLDEAGKQITEAEFHPDPESLGQVPRVQIQNQPGMEYQRFQWFAHSRPGATDKIQAKEYFAPPLLFLSPSLSRLQPSVGFTVPVGMNNSWTVMVFDGKSTLEHDLVVQLTTAELKQLKQVRCTVQFKAAAKTK